MPPTDYLSATGIEACIQYIAATYPAITDLILLPETSVEGRTIRALKIANGGGTERRGVLYLGGTHARELINPDLLVIFGLQLCDAFTNGTGLSFGSKSYSAGTIQLLVDNLDIFLLPLVNPDGRSYVQAPAGDPWWRKNRAPNPGLPCQGVDLNRNYDFLWSSGIGTSTTSCSNVYKGPGAFSEPETRNVRHMLDAYSNICCMIDVHSYSELVLYPWGDDDNQSTDASQNFQNPAFDGLRGTTSDLVYREYIPAADESDFVSVGERLRDAIAAVRGRVYTVQQSVALYPTTGTTHDYAYARHFVDASDHRVLCYTLETATEFQPQYTEALSVIEEVSSGLLEFCSACMCLVETVASGTALVAELDDLRAFRRELAKRPVGREYLETMQANALEVIAFLAKDKRLRRQCAGVLNRLAPVVQSRREKRPKSFDSEVVDSASALLRQVSEKGSNRLKASAKELLRDAKHFRGKPVNTGLRAVELDRRRRAAKRSPSKKSKPKKK